jgi:hypothetical protein
VTAVSNGTARGRKVSEADVLSHIKARLRAEFPEVDEQQIDRAVISTYEGFNDSPIRDFVPILVERSARDSLKGSVPSHCG